MTNESTTFQIAELHYTALFEALPGNSVLFKNNAPTYTILAATPGYLHEIGYTKDKLIGKGLFEAFPANTTDPSDTGETMVLASFRAVLETKQTQYLPIQRYDLQNEDGTFSEKFWKSVNTPVLAPTGEVAYIIHSTEDITAQVKAERREEKLKGIENAYALFMKAPVAINILKGDELIIELANAHSLEIWGKGEEVIGQSLQKFIPESQAQGYPELVEQIRKTGVSHYAYEQCVSLVRNGQPQDVYFNWVLKPVYEEGQSEATGIITFATEVTEQVLARQKVSESEAKYRTLFESMDQGFCILEVLFDTRDQPYDYRFLEVNPVFVKQTGLQAVGKTVRELVPNIESYWINMYSKVALTGEPISFVEESKAMNRWYQANAFKIGGPDSRKVALLFTDITQRKQWEHSLIEKDQNLRNIIHAAPVPMLILRGEDMIVESINERMLQMIGKTSSIVGKPLLEVIPELEGQAGYTSFLTVYRTGKPEYGKEILVPLLNNGALEDRYFNFAYTPIIENGITVGVMDVATEVTEQVRARKRIEESQQELQLAIDLAELGTFRVDLINDISYPSEKVSEWFGYTKESYRRLEGFDPIHPEDRDRVNKVILATFQSAAHSRHDVTYRVVHPINHTVRHLRSFGKTLFNEQGKPYLIIGSVQDITPQILHQKQLEQSEALLQEKVTERTQELEMLNQELQRSNVNLEEFAYAASHDMKEPLRKIHFFSDRLKQQLGNQLTEEQDRLFGRMEGAAKRMSTLIDDLLTYSHISRGASTAEIVDLNQSVQNVLDDLELVIEDKKAKVVIERLPTIIGHKRQLQQLFENLVGNALKYSQQGQDPGIQIHATVVKGQETRLLLKGDAAGKSYHLIEVKDNGIGFDQQDAERIFNVFTRLHGMAEYKGTGVGLSIARKVVENHHGYIWAESQPGKGTSFKILLPVD